MKCDKLKPLVFSLIDLSYVDEPAVEKNFENPHDHAVYKATEVDAAIAELKSENENIKDAFGGTTIAYNQVCDEYEQSNKDLRATKRALWMARKAHAVAMVAYWDSHYRDNPNAVYRNRTVDWLRNRWLLILDAIIKKEKEFK